MPVRLVAIDIDGTLVDSRGHLPDANRDAVAAVVAAGVHVALVTGRSYPFARDVAGALPAAVSIIASNGAVERTLDGVRVAQRLLSRERAQAVLQHTHRFRPTSALIFDRDTQAHVVAESMDWTHPQRIGYWRGRQHLIAQATPLEGALTEDPVQVMFNGTVSEMRAVHALVAGLASVSIFQTEYESRDFALVDVMAPTATKGAALAARASALGLGAHEVMAIGDNLNDLPMLEYAGLPVIMGNAVDALRGRGWTETGRHDEAGVAAALRRHVLEAVADPGQSVVP
jgi:Cof subfamily protein (haloacid dehalogenase superfamily)